MRMLTSRAITTAAAAAIALTTITIQPAAAGSRHGNDAAALAAFAAIFGHRVAHRHRIAAEQQSRQLLPYSHGPAHMRVARCIGGPPHGPYRPLAASPPSVTCAHTVTVRVRASAWSSA